MGLTLFFKKHCLICDNAIPDHLALCVLCKDRMQPFGTETVDLENVAFDSVYAVWVYDDLSGYLIQRLKFYEDFHVLPFLVDSLFGVLQQTELPEVILPVPLHYSRLFKRGFNQTGEIAKRLGKKLHMPVDDRLLLKLKKTKPQAELHVKERTQNLKSAFALKSNLPYRSVALLDDVMTTGATVNEIAALLKKAGAEEVQVWVLARALKNG